MGTISSVYKSRCYLVLTGYYFIGRKASQARSHALARHKALIIVSIVRGACACAWARRLLDQNGDGHGPPLWRAETRWPARPSERDKASQGLASTRCCYSSYALFSNRISFSAHLDPDSSGGVKQVGKKLPVLIKRSSPESGPVADCPSFFVAFT